MRKLLFIIPVLTAVSLSAQEDLDRRVEVTKAYIPEVGKAEKLPMTPRMEDTVALRPEVDYSIASAPWQSAFEVKPIAAAGVDTRLGIARPQLYLKLGAGAPLQSVGDIYFHRGNSRSHWGAYVNHRGEYADIENDLDVKTPAKWSTNRAGIYAGVPIAGRTRLVARADYDWNYFTRYGLAAPFNENSQTFDPGTAGSIGYTSPNANITIGNDFIDLSRFNFSISARGGLFADRRDNEQTHYGFSAAIGKEFGFGALTLGTAWDSWLGGGEWLKNYSDRIARITPEYSVETDRFRLKAGVDATFADNNGESKTWLFPRLSINWDPIQGWLIPFVNVSGELTDNGMESLVRRNPFMAPGSAATENTARWDMYGGISGSFRSAFSYRLFGGTSLYRSRIAMAYRFKKGDTGYFIPLAQDVVQVTLGGELTGSIARSLQATVEMRWNTYPENTKAVKVADMPDVELGAGLRYTWRERLTLTAGVDITGYRYFYYESPDGGLGEVPTTQDPVADLHFSARYTAGKTLGIFIEARNLLDQKLYPWNHYSGSGVNAMGGIEVVF